MPYKVPKSFEIVTALPRTEAGKLNRRALAVERGAPGADAEGAPGAH